MAAHTRDNADGQRRAMPIDILSDDVLRYLADGFLDDRSLGACLLAWRRFHVLDRRALYKRKYRWATFFSLCAAADWDGLAYALERPHVFGTLDGPTWSSCMFVSKGAAHAHMVAAADAFAGHDSWPLDFDLWFGLLAMLARQGRQDALDWLCRRDNSPRVWEDSGAACGCAQVIRADKDDAPATLDRLFGALEAAGDDRGKKQKGVWTTAAAACRDLAPRPREALDAAALTAAVEEAFCAQNREWDIGEPDVESIDELVADGHLRLLRDIVGPDALVACLGHIQSWPDDPDDALWIYDHVDRRAGQGTRPVDRLLHVGACSGRVDLLDRVEAALADRTTGIQRQSRVDFFRAFEMAARSGHAPFVERVLNHRLDTGAMECFFDSRTRFCGRAGDTTAPLFVHRHRPDLVGILLDRRPRRGVLQADVELRVEWTIATAVESASFVGDLAAVRWLHSLAPALVERGIGVLRGLDDCMRP
ncbi:hypothetical protein psal_cds_1095 [Pandoravirus salinus]|uniref:Ankyrin repeat domain containing protein n=1 Tax=Pandoravirus salinus TaxID=1349410 RepID=S4W4P4_9VIRU|nr:hypothetical protein psal_cds_1095 [Pandoravirus salinus]AGO85315.1 hypothetical protein psal_cds_1095 [Pandoravirus salinus]